MRIAVEGDKGDLAARPEDALLALADAAEADGAERSAWLVKAARAAGATRVLARGEESPHPCVRDAARHCEDAHAKVMVLLQSAVKARLRRAAVEADVGYYRRAAEVAS